MKLPYRFFRGSHYPVIPVAIIKDGKRINTSAIVDSGASISIFKGDVVKPIGLNAETGERRVFQAASAKLIGYVHSVKLIVANKEISCKVAFSDELVTSFNLLGRQDVFDNFKVCFNETEKYVEFIHK